MICSVNIVAIVVHGEEGVGIGKEKLFSLVNHWDRNLGVFPFSLFIR